MNTKLKGTYRISLEMLKEYLNEFDNDERLNELNLISVKGIKLSIFRQENK